MATDVMRPEGQGASLVRRIGNFYNGVMVELRKVTWPDRPQVQSATIAIIIFVLFLGLVITALDAVLSGLLVKLIPSLIAK